MGCHASSRVSGPASASIYSLDSVPLSSSSGGFGAVYRGVEKSTNHVVAVKALPKAASEDINLDGELDMLRRFNSHPNIVGFIGSYETAYEINMVFEYMYGGALLNVIPRYGLDSEQDASAYVKDIASALCYLHRNFVAHRNLKPENLMLTHALGGSLKVCDFRCAKSLPSEDAPMWDICGTWAYAAPEVLWLQRTSEGSYTLKCDLFSVGVILYLLLVGYHPFDPFREHTREEMCDNICQGVWSFKSESWYGISPEAKSVVTALLEVDPVKRYKAKQLACHPWIRGSQAFGHTAVVKGDLQQSSERTPLQVSGKNASRGVGLKNFGYAAGVKRGLQHFSDRAPVKIGGKVPHHGVGFNLGKIEEHDKSTIGSDVASYDSKLITGKALPDDFENTNEQPRQQSPRKPKPIEKEAKKFNSCPVGEKAPAECATKHTKPNSRKASPHEFTNTSEQPRQQPRRSPTHATLSPQNKSRDNHPPFTPPSVPMHRPHVPKNQAASTNPKKNKSDAPGRYRTQA